MKAISYSKFGGQLNFAEVGYPILSAQSAIIKVLAAGLCMSDVHAWKGFDPFISLPHIPGHEFCGEVVELDKGVDGFLIGDLVTVPVTCGCNFCEYCASGYQNLCSDPFQPGFTCDGAFAEFILIPKASERLVKLPEFVDPVSSCILGCRFGSAYRALHTLGELKSNDWIAIYGCGGLGLAGVVIATSLDANVIAIDESSRKLGLAKELGAKYIFNANDRDLLQKVEEVTHGGPHVSFESSGSSLALSNSFKSLRKKGKHVQIGFSHFSKNIEASVINLLVEKELEVIGSHGFGISEFKEIFDLLRASKIDLRKLIGRRISLQEAPRVFESLTENVVPGAILIDMSV